MSYAYLCDKFRLVIQLLNDFGQAISFGFGDYRPPAFWAGGLEGTERIMIKRILVALDGSDHANKALDLACEVASKFGAELIAVHVIADNPLSDAERRMAEVEFHAEVAQNYDAARFSSAEGDARLMRQRLAKQAAETGRRFRRALGERLLDNAAKRAKENALQKVRSVLREGDPATTILDAAKQEHADIIVMGRRGLGDLAGLLLGSVSHKVTHLAECACLTVN
jgi:nucleotide-binding universal stress UspA family protein